MNAQPVESTQGAPPSTEPRLDERALLASAQAHVFRASMDAKELAGPILERGAGSVVWDITGKAYLDFNSGQMCSALGHNHPRVVEAIREASQTLIHASSSLLNVNQIRLAETLASTVPAPLQKSFFLLSGSDANEAALAVAKKYTGHFEVASPHTSFHGLSESARAVTFTGWHQGYGPYPAGTYGMLAPYCYRCPVQHTFPQCEFACLKASFELLDAECAAPPAAVITEPLFSAGGVIEPPAGWLPALKRMCEARGTLLVLDEAQTGLAKLGTMWAFEREGVIPDVLTVSKHFGGGMTISAVVTSAEIEAVVAARDFVFMHSHTSDPLACGAGLASLELILEEKLWERAARLGDYWQGHLRRLAERYELIGDVRGRGLIQGVELVWDRERKTPAFEAGPRIAQFCLEKGLLCSVRRGGSVLRFVPPFTTTESQFDAAAETLERAIQAVSGHHTRRRLSA
jgi:2,2-dialkylglycine decarboxylase (pyruvate)